jgi:hypothetical protein
VVLFINMLGLLPVAKGVAGAAKSVKGSALSLAKLPASDSAVSFGEVNSSTVAALMAIAKASEWGAEAESGYDAGNSRFKIAEMVRRCHH